MLYEALEQDVLTCAETQVAFRRLVKVVVEETLWPEPFRLIIFAWRVRDGPMIPGHHGTGRQAISLELIVCY